MTTSSESDSLHCDPISLASFAKMALLEGALIPGTPLPVRLWLAVLSRVDSEGRASFDPHELTVYLGHDQEDATMVQVHGALGTAIQCGWVEPDSTPDLVRISKCLAIGPKH